MYASFYKLTGQPFRLSPDYHFFFRSRPHTQAMAYLTYGLNQREGFIVITGEIGIGKTTLIDYLLSTIDRTNLIPAKIATTQLEADDLLRSAAFAFGIDGEGVDKATLLRRVEAFLVAQARSGYHLLLIVDESQNLTVRALEELRMLSNFQIGERALLQIYLVGQPQFRQILAGDGCEQLRQRIIASYHLAALDYAETRGYIEHRLRQVGWQNDPSFDDGVFRRIYDHTAGIPRKVNVLCERLLLSAYLEEGHNIDIATTDEVIRDLRSEIQVPAHIAQSLTGVDPPVEVSTEALTVAKEAERLFRRTMELQSILQAGQNSDGLGDAPDSINRAAEPTLSNHFGRASPAGVLEPEEGVTGKSTDHVMLQEFERLATNAASLEECLRVLQKRIKDILARCAD